MVFPVGVLIGIVAIGTGTGIEVGIGFERTLFDVRLDVACVGWNFFYCFGDVAQLVRVPDCRSGGCGFESRRPR